MNILKRNVTTVKKILEEIVTDGDAAVDATLGNGNDTIFLASLVGDKGRVYSFDIQERAIEISREKLIENNLASRAILINDSHENIDKYVKERVKAVTFNLGYLPAGDKSIVTKAASTIKAIEKSLDILDEEGIISIVSYKEHDNGKEYKMLDEYLKNLGSCFETVKIDKYNSGREIPINYFIYKR